MMTTTTKDSKLQNATSARKLYQITRTTVDNPLSVKTSHAKGKPYGASTGMTIPLCVGLNKYSRAIIAKPSKVDSSAFARIESRYLNSNTNLLPLELPHAHNALSEPELTG